MSSSSKGNRIETKIRDIWKERDYLIEFKHRSRYLKEKDFFHVWDFITLLGDGSVCFVQVKSTLSGVSEFKNKSRDFLNDYYSRYNCYLIWFYNPKVGERKHRVFEYRGEWVEWQEYDFFRFGFEKSYKIGRRKK